MKRTSPSQDKAESPPTFRAESEVNTAIKPLHLRSPQPSPPSTPSKAAAAATAAAHSSSSSSASLLRRSEALSGSPAHATSVSRGNSAEKDKPTTTPSPHRDRKAPSRGQERQGIADFSLHQRRLYSPEVRSCGHPQPIVLKVPIGHGTLPSSATSPSTAAGVEDELGNADVYEMNPKEEVGMRGGEDSLLRSISEDAPKATTTTTSANAFPAATAGAGGRAAWPAPSFSASPMPRESHASTSLATPPMVPVSREALMHTPQQLSEDPAATSHSPNTAMRDSPSDAAAGQKEGHAARNSETRPNIADHPHNASLDASGIGVNDKTSRDLDRDDEEGGGGDESGRRRVYNVESARVSAKTESLAEMPLRPPSDISSPASAHHIEFSGEAKAEKEGEEETEETRKKTTDEATPVSHPEKQPPPQQPQREGSPVFPSSVTVRRFQHLRTMSSSSSELTNSLLKSPPSETERTVDVDPAPTEPTVSPLLSYQPRNVRHSQHPQQPPQQQQQQDQEQRLLLSSQRSDAATPAATPPSALSLARATFSNNSEEKKNPASTRGSDSASLRSEDVNNNNVNNGAHEDDSTAAFVSGHDFDGAAPITDDKDAPGSLPPREAVKRNADGDASSSRTSLVELTLDNGTLTHPADAPLRSLLDTTGHHEPSIITDTNSVQHNDEDEDVDDDDDEEVKKENHERSDVEAAESVEDPNDVLADKDASPASAAEENTNEDRQHEQYDNQQQQQQQQQNLVSDVDAVANLSDVEEISDRDVMFADDDEQDEHDTTTCEDEQNAEVIGAEDKNHQIEPLEDDIGDDNDDDDDAAVVVDETVVAPQLLTREGIGALTAAGRTAMRLPHPVTTYSIVDSSRASFTSSNMFSVSPTSARAARYQNLVEVLSMSSPASLGCGSPLFEWSPQLAPPGPGFLGHLQDSTYTIQHSSTDGSIGAAQVADFVMDSLAVHRDPNAHPHPHQHHHSDFTIRHSTDDEDPLAAIRAAAQNAESLHPYTGRDSEFSIQHSMELSTGMRRPLHDASAASAPSLPQEAEDVLDFIGKTGHDAPLQETRGTPTRGVEETEGDDVHPHALGDVAGTTEQKPEEQQEEVAEGGDSIFSPSDQQQQQQQQWRQVYQKNVTRRTSETGGAPRGKAVPPPLFDDATGQAKTTPHSHNSSSTPTSNSSDTARPADSQAQTVATNRTTPTPVTLSQQQQPIEEKVTTSGAEVSTSRSTAVADTDGGGSRAVVEEVGETPLRDTPAAPAAAAAERTTATGVEEEKKGNFVATESAVELLLRDSADAPLPLRRLQGYSSTHPAQQQQQQQQQQRDALRKRYISEDDCARASQHAANSMTPFISLHASADTAAPHSSMSNHHDSSGEDVLIQVHDDHTLQQQQQQQQQPFAGVILPLFFSGGAGQKRTPVLHAPSQEQEEVQAGLQQQQQQDEDEKAASVVEAAGEQQHVERSFDEHAEPDASVKEKPIDSLASPDCVEKVLTKVEEEDDTQQQEEGKGKESTLAGDSAAPVLAETPTVEADVDSVLSRDAVDGAEMRPSEMPSQLSEDRLYDSTKADAEDAVRPAPPLRGAAAAAVVVATTTEKSSENECSEVGQAALQPETSARSTDAFQVPPPPLSRAAVHTVVDAWRWPAAMSASASPAAATTVVTSTSPLHALFNAIAQPRSTTQQDARRHDNAVLSGGVVRHRDVARDLLDDVEELSEVDLENFPAGQKSFHQDVAVAERDGGVNDEEDTTAANGGAINGAGVARTPGSTMGAAKEEEEEENGRRRNSADELLRAFRATAAQSDVKVVLDLERESRRRIMAEMLDERALIFREEAAAYSVLSLMTRHTEYERMKQQHTNKPATTTTRLNKDVVGNATPPLISPAEVVPSMPPLDAMGTPWKGKSRTASTPSGVLLLPPSPPAPTSRAEVQALLRTRGLVFGDASFPIVSAAIFTDELLHREMVEEEEDRARTMLVRLHQCAADALWPATLFATEALAFQRLVEEARGEWRQLRAREVSIDDEVAEFADARRELALCIVTESEERRDVVERAEEAGRQRLRELFWSGLAARLRMREVMEATVSLAMRDAVEELVFEEAQQREELRIESIREWTSVVASASGTAVRAALSGRHGAGTTNELFEAQQKMKTTNNTDSAALAAAAAGAKEHSTKHVGQSRTTVRAVLQQEDDLSSESSADSSTSSSSSSSVVISVQSSVSDVHEESDHDDHNGGDDPNSTNARIDEQNSSAGAAHPYNVQGSSPDQQNPHPTRGSHNSHEHADHNNNDSSSSSRREVFSSQEDEESHPQFFQWDPTSNSAPSVPTASKSQPSPSQQQQSHQQQTSTSSPSPHLTNMTTLNTTSHTTGSSSILLSQSQQHPAAAVALLKGEEAAAAAAATADDDDDDGKRQRKKQHRSTTTESRRSPTLVVPTTPPSNRNAHDEFVSPAERSALLHALRRTEAEVQQQQQQSSRQTTKTLDDSHDTRHHHKNHTHHEHPAHRPSKQEESAEVDDCTTSRKPHTKEADECSAAAEAREQPTGTLNLSKPPLAAGVTTRQRSPLFLTRHTVPCSLRHSPQKSYHALREKYTAPAPSREKHNHHNGGDLQVKMAGRHSPSSSSASSSPRRYEDADVYAYDPSRTTPTPAATTATTRTQVVRARLPWERTSCDDDSHVRNGDAMTSEVVSVEQTDGERATTTTTTRPQTTAAATTTTMEIVLGVQEPRHKNNIDTMNAEGREKVRGRAEVPVTASNDVTALTCADSSRVLTPAREVFPARVEPLSSPYSQGGNNARRDFVSPVKARLTAGDGLATTTTSASPQVVEVITHTCVPTPHSVRTSHDVSLSPLTPQRSPSHQQQQQQKKKTYAAPTASWALQQEQRQRDRRVMQQIQADPSRESYAETNAGADAIRGYENGKYGDAWANSEKEGATSLLPGGRTSSSVGGTSASRCGYSRPRELPYSSALHAAVEQRGEDAEDKRDGAHHRNHNTINRNAHRAGAGAADGPLLITRLPFEDGPGVWSSVACSRDFDNAVDAAGTRKQRVLSTSAVIATTFPPRGCTSSTTAPHTLESVFDAAARTGCVVHLPSTVAEILRGPQHLHLPLATPEDDDDGEDHDAFRNANRTWTSGDGDGWKDGGDDGVAGSDDRGNAVMFPEIQQQRQQQRKELLISPALTPQGVGSRGAYNYVDVFYKQPRGASTSPHVARGMKRSPSTGRWNPIASPFPSTSAAAAAKENSGGHGEVVRVGRGVSVSPAGAQFVADRCAAVRERERTHELRALLTSQREATLKQRRKSTTPSAPQSQLLSAEERRSACAAVTDSEECISSSNINSRAPWGARDDRGGAEMNVEEGDGETAAEEAECFFDQDDVLLCSTLANRVRRERASAQTRQQRTMQREHQGREASTRLSDKSRATHAVAAAAAGGNSGSRGSPSSSVARRGTQQHKNSPQQQQVFRSPSTSFSASPRPRVQSPSRDVHIPPNYRVLRAPSPSYLQSRTPSQPAAQHSALSPSAASQPPAPFSPSFISFADPRTVAAVQTAAWYPDASHRSTSTHHHTPARSGVSFSHVVPTTASGSTNRNANLTNTVSSVDRGSSYATQSLYFNTSAMPRHGNGAAAVHAGVGVVPSAEGQGGTGARGEWRGVESAS